MHDELKFTGQCQKGDSGPRVKIIQEWLGLHGMSVVIDGIFGPATEAAVHAFQTRFQAIATTGIVDLITWNQLIYPMLQALAPIKSAGRSLSEMMVAYAMQHLMAYPCEIGGQNRGPWVRLYTNGKEGPEWPWCAGFVSFIMQQACETMKCNTPLIPSLSCYILATEAKERHIFRPEGKPDTKSGSLFLVKKPGGWSHVGIVTRHINNDVFETIEGNTNDSGDPEGYEVCERIRSFAGKDFIVL